MFDEVPESLGQRDEATRLMLLELLMARGQYNEAVNRLNELRISALLQPSPENDQAVRDYELNELRPRRDAMHDKGQVVLKAAVDVGALKKLAPAILAAVLEHVDLPMLFLVIGAEPSTLDAVIARVRAYIASGMDTSD